MKRSFNYTGRVEVERSDITFEPMAGPTGVRITKIQLDEYDFPPDSTICLEVHERGSVEVVRRVLGTAADLSLPFELPLRDSLMLNGYLSLKVVGGSAKMGQLLGLSGDLGVGAGSDSLIPVNPTNLASEVWRLNMASPSGDGRPVLDVNKLIPGIMETVAGPVFRSLVHPEIARRVLCEILLSGEAVDAESKDWRGNWLRWGIAVHPDHDDPMLLDSDDLKSGWVDVVVAAFAARLNSATEFQSISFGGRSS